MPISQSHQYNPVSFDTLSYAKRLQNSGFTQEQAEIQAETFFNIIQDQLVSKRDLYDVEKNLKFDMENIRKDLRFEISNLSKELKIWFGGMLVIVIGVLSGIMTLIVHLPT